MSPRAEDSDDVRIVVARLEGVHEKLDEIHTEVKRTNGRVTLLEQQAAISRALEAKGVTDKDWTMKMLLAVVAVATLVEPVVLAVFFK